MLKIGPENIMFLNSTEFFSDNDEDNILNINSFKFDLAKEEIKDIFKYSIKNENNNINLCNGLKSFHCNFDENNSYLSQTINNFDEEKISENLKSNLSTRDNYNLNRKKKRKIFKVIITRKKIAGRKRKKDKKEEEEEEENINIHSKKSKDNIIRKIKVHSFKFAKNLINNCIKHEFGKFSRKKIRSIKGELISDITINFNIEFFNSTLERIFSNPINQKYKNTDLNQNIIEITKIRQSKEAKLTNELLDSTFNDIYDMFINYEKEKNENKFFKHIKKSNIKSLNEFLKDENPKDNEYINNLRYCAINIKQFFNQKKARNSFKKGNKFIGTNFEGF